MSTRLEDWKHYATPDIGIDTKRYFDHTCGEGKTLIVSRSVRGYSAWCLRCSIGDSWRGPQESLADLLARVQATSEADSQLLLSGGMPEDSQQAFAEWPTQCKLWLLKAGLGSADARALGAYYTAKSDRVVIPVGRAAADGTRYYQARACEPRPKRAKYLGPTQKPRDLHVAFGSADTVTLTEDILSAYKVGKAGHEAWPILGTSVSAHYLSLLLARECKVNVWLDPDAAGVRSAQKYIKQLRAYGIEPRNIVSAKDPKLTFIPDIKELLHGNEP